MSVIVNLQMGAYCAGTARGSRTTFEGVRALSILKERKRSCLESLSGGEQQMLAVGRASSWLDPTLPWMNRAWAYRRSWWKGSGGTLSATSIDGHRHLLVEQECDHGWHCHIAPTYLDGADSPEGRRVKSQENENCSKSLFGGLKCCAPTGSR